MGPQEERSLWLLHQAMLDACSPGSICRDYYAEYPCRGDFGYLPGLVAECQQQVSSLPGYPAAKTEVLALVSLYAHLQTYKHLDKSFRAERLQDWIRPHLIQFPDLYWWEFAAASGSTLGVFALFRRSAQRGMTADEARCLVDAYFPWICGLHILLDYLIDQGEDEEEGDLNFVLLLSQQRGMPAASGPIHQGGPGQGRFFAGSRLPPGRCAGAPGFIPIRSEGEKLGP